MGVRRVRMERKKQRNRHRIPLILATIAFFLPLGACGAKTTDSSVPTISSLEEPVNKARPGDVWNGEIDETWYDPSSKEFSLSTAQQLAGLSSLVGKGVTFKKKTVSLAKDILLNDLSAGSSFFDLPPKNAWSPIGQISSNGTTRFEGTFDGCGHRIRGMYVCDDKDAVEKGWQCAGLFGVAAVCDFDGHFPIKNVSLTESCMDYNASKRRVQYSGAVCAYLVDGGLYGRMNGILNTFTECKTRFAYAPKMVGGVVGFLQGNIFNSGFVGVFKAIRYSASIGGIAHGGAKPAYVVNCYSDVRLNDTETFFGHPYQCGAITTSATALYSYYREPTVRNIETVRTFAVARRIEIDTTLLSVGNGTYAAYGSPAVLAPIDDQRYEDNFVFGDNRKEGYRFDMGDNLADSLNAFSFAHAFGGIAENDAILTRFIRNGEFGGAPHFAEAN